MNSTTEITKNNGGLDLTSSDASVSKPCPVPRYPLDIDWLVLSYCVPEYLRGYLINLIKRDGFEIDETVDIFNESNSEWEFKFRKGDMLIILNIWQHPEEKDKRIVEIRPLSGNRWKFPEHFWKWTSNKRTFIHINPIPPRKEIPTLVSPSLMNFR